MHTHATPRSPLVPALDYIQQHLSEHIRLETLAGLVNLSIWQFSVLFRQHMGIPPYRYVNQQRIACARTLLRQGMPSVEVAAACGFYDQSHFSRHFKQHCGMTPGQYSARLPHPPIQSTYERRMPRFQ